MDSLRDILREDGLAGLAMDWLSILLGFAG